MLNNLTAHKIITFFTPLTSQHGFTKKKVAEFKANTSKYSC